MLLSTLLFLPALIAQAPVQAPSTLLEVSPGIYVLKGIPTPGTYAEVKRLRIKHVLDLRRDGDSQPEPDAETEALADVGADYTRYAISRTPPGGDLDFLRQILRGMPRGERVLIHCTDGNRAGAAVCPWLVLDRGMKLDEAIKVCRQGGMVYPETEAAVRKYLGAHGKT